MGAENPRAVDGTKWSMEISLDSQKKMIEQDQEILEKLIDQTLSHRPVVSAMTMPYNLGWHNLNRRLLYYKEFWLSSCPLYIFANYLDENTGLLISIFGWH